MWYELSFRNHAGADQLSADVYVPAESPWFSGHFPGNPVLPGVAQLGMVYEVIRHALDCPVRVLEISRVKFKRMILPEDRLTIMVAPRSGRSGPYAFRIVEQEELVCSGTMTVEADFGPE